MPLSLMHTRVGSAVATASSAASARSALRAAPLQRPLLPRRDNYNAVMSSAPTVTIYSGNSTITGSGTPTINPVTSGLVTLVGGAGWAAPASGNAASYAPYTTAQNTNGLRYNPYKILFYCDASQVEFSFYFPASTGKYRIKVDDQLTASGTQDSAVSGATRWLNINFGSAAVRRISIETSAFVIGLNTTATGTVWPARPRGPRVLAFGDSYTNGSNGNDAIFTTWPHRMADILGWEDIWNLSIGSTGYIATVGGYANTTADQVARAVALGVSADVVLCGAGHNDTASDATIAAAAASAFQAMRTAWPAALLACIGPFWTGGAGSMSSWAAREAALQPAVANIADVFIPQASGSDRPFFTGTGKVGATTSSGNSDAYVYSDGIHPTQAGHDYLGARFAQELTNWLGF